MSEKKKGAALVGWSCGGEKRGSICSPDSSLTSSKGRRKKGGRLVPGLLGREEEKVHRQLSWWKGGGYVLRPRRKGGGLWGRLPYVGKGEGIAEVVFQAIEGGIRRHLPWQVRSFLSGGGGGGSMLFRRNWLPGGEEVYFSSCWKEK